jgi:hypothetical protein
MTEKKSIWLGFVGSFNPEYYKGIVTQSFGRSFGYFFLLIIAVSIIFSIKYTVFTRGVIGDVVTWINTEFAERLPEFLPEISIQDGEVSSPAEQPYIHEWEEFVFVLDTTGSITSLDDYQNGVLITKKSIIIRTIENGRVKTEEHDLSMLTSLNIGPGKEEGELITFSFQEQQLSITQENVTKWSKFIGWALIPLIVVFLFFYHFTAKFIYLLFFSLFSLIANKIVDAGLEYGHLLNIGIFALTPPLALAVFAKMLSLTIPMFWLLYIFVYCAFLIMAIKRCKTRNNEEASLHSPIESYNSVTHSE